MSLYEWRHHQSVCFCTHLLMFHWRVGFGLGLHAFFFLKIVRLQAKSHGMSLYELHSYKFICFCTQSTYATLTFWFWGGLSFIIFKKKSYICEQNHIIWVCMNYVATNMYVFVCDLLTLHWWLSFRVDLHAFIKIVRLQTSSFHMSLYEIPNNLVTKIMYNIIHIFL